MPKYYYRCLNDHIEEIAVSNERPLTLICSLCGATTKRQFPTNQHLRFGPDPYERDFREMEANGELNG